MIWQIVPLNVLSRNGITEGACHDIVEVLKRHGMVETSDDLMTSSEDITAGFAAYLPKDGEESIVKAEEYSKACRDRQFYRSEHHGG